jgi:hypothetical protein
MIWGADRTRDWRAAADAEVKRLTSHLSPSHQAVARALVADCTTGGQYYWSQERLGRRAGVRRETTNRAVRRLSGDLEILHVSKKQRGYNEPKTLSLSRWFLSRIFRAVMRSLCRSLSHGHTRKAKPYVEGSPSPRGGGAGITLKKLLRSFREKRRYGGGWMVRCPAHADRTPSLSLGEGENGKLLMHCHAGCPHEAVREALGLPPPRPKRPKLNFKYLDLSRLTVPTTEA